MSEKRFFTKINSKGRLVIIDKDCHTELIDMYLACEVLNRLDLKRRVFIEENEQLRKQNRIYEYFIDENDLNIDWSYFCTASDCEETESDCKYCEYMKLVEKND